MVIFGPFSIGLLFPRRALRCTGATQGPPGIRWEMRPDLLRDRMDSSMSFGRAGDAACGALRRLPHVQRPTLGPQRRNCVFGCAEPPAPLIPVLRRAAVTAQRLVSCFGLPRRRPGGAATRNLSAEAGFPNPPISEDRPSVQCGKRQKCFKK